MLAVSKLAFERGMRLLFSELSFSLKAGELLHVKGENGSGKTSLMKILAGLSPLKSGEMKWQGDKLLNNSFFLSELLYIGHKAALKSTLSASQNLLIYCRINSFALPFGKECYLSRVEEALEQMELSGLEDVPVYSLSAGQKRRVVLARLLLESRKLWILDEPFTALDQSAISFIERCMAEHLKNGGLIILSTHQALQNELLIEGSDFYRSLDLGEYGRSHE